MSGSKRSTGTERDEARYEAAPIVRRRRLQLLLALISRSEGWELWALPWWCWFALIVPEALLIVCSSGARIPAS